MGARPAWHIAAAGAEAVALLDPARGALQLPIRSEIFGSTRFKQHGRSLGQAHAAQWQARGADAFFPRIEENIRVLREAQHYIAIQAHTGRHISPAGEWLLDNFYVVVAQLKEIHDGLPRRYYRDLPVLLDPPLAGLPRVYGMAWALVAHTDGAFDEALLIDFIVAYQETRELALGELWALPTTLRVVLIENLRRLAERVAVTKAAREAANLWCDTLDESGSVDAQGVFDAMGQRGVAPAFALQVMHRLHADPRARSLPGERNRELVRAALSLTMTDPAAAQLALQAEEAADNLSVGNAITSLRLLGDTEWREVIAQSSILMQRMQTSPVFTAERDDTQDGTLHAIERLARRSGRSELDVADALLLLMRAAPDLRMPDAAAQSESPSYWLRGPGSPALCRAIGLRGVASPGWSRLRPHLTLPLYLATLALASVGLTLVLVLPVETAGAETAWLAVTALLALWPASEAVVAGVNRLISEWVPPRRLPRLAFTDGIPAEHRVLVVVPAMLVDIAGVHRLAAQLERHSLANREPHAQFALLTDHLDADAETTEADKALLAAAIDAIDAIEARHHGGADAPRRFLLLHRERRWCKTEQRWIGWERKRGKLEQLLALLAGPASSSPDFVDLGRRSQPAAQTPYVVTLDSDTQLPPNALRELVGVAAHPLNRPRVDARRRRVVTGYGILQPRLVTPLPSARESTPFHWLFAGHCGIDPYSASSSELYQDVFDAGTFTGKGLLHVQAMHQVLGGRFAEGRILSHDLAEGAIARCGGVSDIALIESAPVHADAAAARVSRWVRGDWQLLPLLLQPRRFDLRAVDRWKMLDNLRRSLVAPVSLLLLLVSLAGGPLAPWKALLLIAAAYGSGGLFGAIAGLAPSRDHIALSYFYRSALADLGRAVAATLWNLALLLRHALSMGDAIGRALWRMAISQRHLLQWTTAATSEAAVATDVGGLVRHHRGVVGLAVLVLATLLALRTPEPWLAVACGALWGGTPWWIGWASRARPPPRSQALDATDREYLLGVARDTWRWFELHVGTNSQGLPPDNVQTSPMTMVAQRTSPTNIGLYLLAVACARRFGWIDSAQLLARCEHTLATLDRLERHRGHFLNWYDTQSLAPLSPTYVSTVDSGNLCGHLLALAGACDETVDGLDAATSVSLAARLADLAARCRRLAEAAEFGFLYDARRRLFHIGYRPFEQQLDRSYYDLLASEARLASLWAIAKGDVPASHWAALGRPYFADGAQAGLRSWSGSMFEYLMPSLTLEEPAGSVLARAARAALHEQRSYASRRDVPWGISESAYAVSDHTLAYQYAPQGVPRLALRRAPPDDLVVAPYATALAAMLAPHLAADNLRRLESLHARGDLGFIEALDYSAERQSDTSRFTPVLTGMAHHQGMSLVALTNVLHDGVVRCWGMADARLNAVASLLQERMPREVSRLLEVPPAPSRAERTDVAPVSARDIVPGENALQFTHLLSNGRYSVTLRSNGAGWSRFGGADVSRWRDDALRDAYGTFFYLRRERNRVPVSITQHPAPDPGADYRASFHSGHVVFDTVWADMRSRCTVWVSAEDDIELRRIELWNTSSEPITFELLSMFELVMAEARADEAHPAFSNLFVSADWRADERALYFARQPRLSTEPGRHAVHFVAQADHQLRSVEPQVDRAGWLGRGRDAASPLARYARGVTASGALTTGLDPIASLSMRLALPAHGVAHLVVGTAAAASRDALEVLVDRYRQGAVVERSAQMSATLAGARARETGMTVEDRQSLLLLTTTLALLLARPASTASTTSDPADTACDRRSLWRFGISGDRPIIVATIGSVQGLRLVRSLVQALPWWSWGAMACDLVIVNAEPRSYLMPLQAELLALAQQHSETESKHCALHLVFADEVSSAEMAAFKSLARALLRADGRPLSHHVQVLAAWHDAALVARLEGGVTALATAAASSAQRAATGSFDPDSGAFSFSVDATRRPARPWINVLANPDFGTQVSEAGAGYSWAGNSRLHALTPWSNDPVTDPAGEWFLLQDLRSREVWSVGAGGGGEDSVGASGAAATATSYTVEHGPGWTTIAHRRGELEVLATWCVDDALSIKQVRLALRQHGTRRVRLRVIGVCEWLLGERRADRQSVRTAFETLVADGASAVPVGVLLATQSDAHAGFGGSTAFFSLQGSASRGAEMNGEMNTEKNAELDDWTCDRRELFDARGHRVVPDRFGQRAGAGLDPCAAISATVSLAPGERAECVFTLGHGATPAAARELARMALSQHARQRETDVRARWEERLGAVTVHTPDPLFDVLINRWLLYQTVACRLWARAAFYQAGGAFGFRDQLQDTMALAVTAPQLLRAQLLLSASRQFFEGDVQHWWHPPTGAGVRTRMSDDLLWLPEATARYIDVSGDAAVLEEEVLFLEGEPIAEGAEDRYDVPRTSERSATLYEHCAMTIDRSLAVGVHGLPLMGTGDWNDGMNRVGHQGRGESVWLGWFLCHVVAQFARLASARGDTSRVLAWEAAARGWRVALQGAAWDGEWFVRAFFDDGTPLGSHTNTECRIDLIAQAWSVLSAAALPAQQQLAMASVERLLVDEGLGVVRLLDPPLAKAEPEAGYIQSYPPGVRENGGQYSHAGVWALMARAALGDADGAWRLFELLSPAHRAANPQLAAAYEIEPYVMAGDVYTQPPYVGRGGWSWYTGSAAWMHRAAVESICGLRVQNGRVCVRPCLPSHWPEVRLRLRQGGVEHLFIVCAASADAAIASALAAGAMPLAAGEWLTLADGASQNGRLVVQAAVEHGPGPASAPRPEAPQRIQAM
ncbi:MAG: glucoamylase family protein [Rubrivivax sp.]